MSLQNCHPKSFGNFQVQLESNAFFNALGQQLIIHILVIQTNGAGVSLH